MRTNKISWQSVKAKTTVLNLGLVLLISVGLLFPAEGPSRAGSQGTTQSTVFVGHTDQLGQVAVSSDSRFIVSSSFDGTIRLWDISSGREIHRFPHKCDGVFGLTFSTDGRFILCGCNDPEAGVRVWDKINGRQVRYFGSGNFENFSPDARFVIYHELPGSHLGGQICVWNVETEREVTCLPNTRRVASFAFSSDGRHVVTSDDNGPVRLWDATSGKMIRGFIGEAGGAALWSDGQRIRAADCNSIETWEVQSGRRQIRRLAGPALPGGEGCNGAFSPSGRWYMVFFGSSLRLYDAQNGSLVRSFTGHKNQIVRMAFSPDGRFAVSGSADKTIRLWRLPE